MNFAKALLIVFATILVGGMLTIYILGFRGFERQIELRIFFS